MDNTDEYIVLLSVLDNVVRLCGGPHGATGLRASCKNFWRAIDPPTHYGDEEDMLVCSAWNGNVAACCFALERGACNIMIAASVAAYRGHHSIYHILARLLDKSSINTSYFCTAAPVEANTNWRNSSIYHSAHIGGDTDIIRDVHSIDANSPSRSLSNGELLFLIPERGPPSDSLCTLALATNCCNGDFKRVMDAACNMYMGGFTGEQRYINLAVADEKAFASFESTLIIDASEHYGFGETEMTVTSDSIWDYMLCGATAACSTARCDEAIRHGARDFSCMLLFAVRSGSLPMCEFAVQHGAEVECIHMALAASKGNIAVMHWLHGKNPELLLDSPIETDDRRWIYSLDWFCPATMVNESYFCGGLTVLFSALFCYVGCSAVFDEIESWKTTACIDWDYLLNSAMMLDNYEGVKYILARCTSVSPNIICNSACTSTSAIKLLQRYFKDNGIPEPVYQDRWCCPPFALDTYRKKVRKLMGLKNCE